MAIGIDEVDRKILRELQRDGALSSATLAERVGASQASCWRRVKLLEESGLLGKAVRLVDSTMMGLGVNVICHIRLKDHTPQSSITFRDYITKIPDVLECYSMSGEWDYMLIILSRDVSSYENFLMEQLLSHPKVGQASSHFALSRVKFTTEIAI